VLGWGWCDSRLRFITVGLLFVICYTGTGEFARSVICEAELSYCRVQYLGTKIGKKSLKIN
jgi:hypothetical protein